MVQPLKVNPKLIPVLIPFASPAISDSFSRQDATQYLASWFKYIDVSKEACQEWMIENDFNGRLNGFYWSKKPS